MFVCLYGKCIPISNACQCGKVIYYDFKRLSSFEPLRTLAIISFISSGVLPLARLAQDNFPNNTAGLVSFIILFISYHKRL